MQPSKILIFGQGQLGTFYREYFEGKGVEVLSPRLDIRDIEVVKTTIKEIQPDLAINAVAKTNIDWCEQNKSETFEVNVLGADNIAKICQEEGIYLLHISSGCVQESKNISEVRSETDPVHPLCFYSWTKVWAEEMLLDRMNHYGLKVLMPRPRQLLSAMVSPRNAVTKMLTYNKFIDAPQTCTIVEDLLWATEKLINDDVIGVVNVANQGVITPYEIAEMLKDVIKPEMEFVKISKDELNAMTLARRVDCVLNLGRLKSLGIELPEIHERLYEILLKFKENLQTDSGQAVMENTKRETAEKLALK